VIRFQIGPQPVQGLLTQARVFFGIERVRILALAAARASGGAGGVVAVLLVQVIGQLTGRLEITFFAVGGGVAAGPRPCSAAAA
jgi:hypothetical protein